MLSSVQVLNTRSEKHFENAFTRFCGGLFFPNWILILTTKKIAQIHLIIHSLIHSSLTHSLSLACPKHD